MKLKFEKKLTALRRTAFEIVIVSIKKILPNQIKNVKCPSTFYKSRHQILFIYFSSIDSPDNIVHLFLSF